MTRRYIHQTVSAQTRRKQVYHNQVKNSDQQSTAEMIQELNQQEKEKKNEKEQVLF